MAASPNNTSLQDRYFLLWTSKALKQTQSKNSQLIFRLKVNMCVMLGSEELFVQKLRGTEVSDMLLESQTIY